MKKIHGAPDREHHCPDSFRYSSYPCSLVSSASPINMKLLSPFTRRITTELSLLFWEIPEGAITVKLPVPNSKVSPTEGYCTLIAFGCGSVHEIIEQLRSMYIIRTKNIFHFKIIQACDQTSQMILIIMG